MYDWEDCHLGDAALEDAREELEFPKSDSDVINSFGVLLRSGDIDAMCVALSYYHYCESMSRHGGENILEGESQDVLECARVVLRRPPSKVATAEHDEYEAAHATALSAIAGIVQPEDSGLVSEALRRATSEDVRKAAAMAASTILRDTLPGCGHKAALLNELIDQLAEIIFDDSVSSQERWLAINAVSQSGSEIAESYLVGALELTDVQLQAVAGLALADRDMGRFRPILMNLTASWSDDSEFPANELISILREGE
ncbi:hypothetical protein [Streptomyces scopuliridis]|uniref:hypothetical protein n=1 Tax=Streptomyces scopuliridis TaxID=452529 RepID=UPI0010583861|nr:hypothetical protein [Streptomyces scopuliridis]